MTTRQLCQGLVAGMMSLAAASASHAAFRDAQTHSFGVPGFLGVDLVMDPDATAAARALAGDTPELADATVYQLVAAFDEDGFRFDSVFNLNFQIGSGGRLFQETSVGADDSPPSDAFIGFVSAVEFDSFATFNGGEASLDSNGFVTRQSQGLTGAGLTGESGWFTTPSTGLGFPVLNNEAVVGLDANIDLSSVYTVWLGQFTAIGLAPGSEPFMSGSIGVGFNRGVDPNTGLGGDPFQGIIAIVPAPSAVSCLALAGLASSRRRRR